MSRATLEAADDFPVPVPDGRHGQGNIEQAAVLAAALGFIMVDALAPADARQNRGLLVAAALPESEVNTDFPMISSAV